MHELKLENPRDNFDRRSLIHLVATQYVNVGFISREKLFKLYEQYPYLKELMQQSNRKWFDIGRKSVELFLTETTVEPITREACVNVLLKHYEKSSTNDYQEIVKSVKLAKMNELS